jgi:hypothetical protein
LKNFLELLSCFKNFPILQKETKIAQRFHFWQVKLLWGSEKRTQWGSEKRTHYLQKKRIWRVTRHSCVFYIFADHYIFDRQD